MPDQIEQRSVERKYEDQLSKYIRLCESDKGVFMNTDGIK